MPRPKSLLFVCLLVASTVVVSTADRTIQDVLTNDAVIALVKAGLGPTTIIAKVRTSSSQFDVSIKGLIDLKAKGVPDDVIQAMVEKSSSTPGGPAPGSALETARLFLLGADGLGVVTQESIETSIARQRFAVGLFSVGTQVVLPGRFAKVQIQDARPTFLFQFANDSESPSQYLLARLEESDEGGGRKLDPDSALRFDTAQTGPREFQVRPTKDLKRGEYCFYMAEQLKDGAGQQGSIRVFDFDVLARRR